MIRITIEVEDQKMVFEQIPDVVNNFKATEKIKKSKPVKELNQGVHQPVVDNTTKPPKNGLHYLKGRHASTKVNGKTCPECGIKYTPTGNAQVYCSEICKTTAKNQKSSDLNITSGESLKNNRVTEEINSIKKESSVLIENNSFPKEKFFITEEQIARSKDHPYNSDQHGLT